MKTLMKTHKLLLIGFEIALCFSMTYSFSQSVKSTAISPQGIVFPQLSTSEINSLGGQAKGTTVFDKDQNVMKYWNGGAWIAMQNGATGGWAASGNDISNGNAGNVGIGIATPQAKLHINGNTAIQGNSELEFGKGLTKETNAGKIGYGILTPDVLDIVGAGGLVNERRIKFWNEGGVTFMGEVHTPTTGDAHMLPIAYALIQGTGSASSSTGNITSVWDGTCGCYKIDAGSDVFDTVVSVTPNSLSPLTATVVRGSSTQHSVYIFNTNGVKVQSNFHIIVYKR